MKIENALNGGIGFEFYPKHRLIARVDFSDSVYRTPGFSTCVTIGGVPSCGTFPAAATKSLEEVSFALSYRLGSLQPIRQSPDVLLVGSQPHPFLDAAGVALITAEVGTILADGIFTERAFKGSPDTFGERDPIARPFVRAGWPGMALGSAIFASGGVALQYLLHRTNHHRVERLLPAVLAVIEVRNAVGGNRYLSSENRP